MALKDIMANAKTALVNAQLSGSPAFIAVYRARIIGQAATAVQRPIAGIWRAVNKPKYGAHCTQTREQVTNELVLVVEVAGAGIGGGDAVDDEMIDLRAAVATALSNNSLGGNCAPLEPYGDESSLGITATPGYEQIAFRTAYTENKPSVT